MELLRDHLDQLVASSSVIKLWRCDIDSEDPFTGVILDYDGSFFVFGFVNDDDGTTDGISVMRTGDVTSIESGGNMLSSIEKLMADEKAAFNKKEIDLSSIKNAIKSVQDNYGYVAIHSEYSSEGYFIGTVDKIDDQYVLLNKYGSMSALDRGKVLLPLQDISRVDADARYEKSIVKLVTTHNK